MIRFGIVALLGIALPFMVPQYALTVIVAALIFGLFAMSLDLMVGYCRLFSFGHAAAYGLGAYAAGLILIHGQSDWLEPEDGEEPEEIAPGVYLGDAGCLRRIAETEEGKTARYRVFAGYSGWGPDQLESELAAGAWIIAPATADLVFDTSVDELWDHLSPPAIPRPSNN